MCNFEYGNKAELQQQKSNSLLQFKPNLHKLQSMHFYVFWVHAGAFPMRLYFT